MYVSMAKVYNKTFAISIVFFIFFGFGDKI